MKKRILSLILCAIILAALPGCARPQDRSGQQVPQIGIQRGLRRREVEYSADDRRRELEALQEQQRQERDDRSPVPETRPADRRPEPETRPEPQQPEDSRPAAHKKSMPEEAYPRNNARSYYWREHLTGESAAIYDALYELAIDPYAADRKVSFYTSNHPESQAYKDNYLIANQALLLDHPEFFYMDYHAAPEGSKPVKLVSWNTPQLDSTYRIDFELQDRRPELASLITRFNIQAQAFIDMIDYSQPQAQVAKQIHDLLIWNVNYDYDTFENKDDDFAYTAFGALSSNGAGEPFRAVCMGYALAYHYLLQQGGMDSLVILGTTVDDKGEGGRHAWNMVQIDGQWKEVDVTWDDVDSNKEKAIQGPHGEIARRAYEDSAYVEKASHAFFLISTAQIENFTAGEDMRCHVEGGWYMMMSPWSSHRRPRRNEEYSEWYLMDMAPIAY